VAELGLTGAVQFMGFRDDRLAILPSFDCFVLTSSLEGIPRCLMEAMAAGVCITAFDIPGVDRLIEHEQTGLLAEFNNTDLLRQQWLRLYDDAKLKQQLAAAGKQYVYKHFSAEAMASAYNALYMDIITRS
ncbi:MAG: glycosyltransferase, partial [Paraglaciecola sp.]|nr:glycosyltransferase [Paraglaciecola sp.]